MLFLQGGFLFSVVSPMDSVISLGLSVTAGSSLGKQVRIHTEEEAKVVAADWGERIYSIPWRASCFAPERYEEKEELHQDGMKKRKNSTYSSNRPVPQAATTFATGTHLTIIP